MFQSLPDVRLQATELSLNFETEVINSDARDYKLPLHKKWNFPLRISSVNAAKSAGTADLVTFTKEILNGKLYFCAMC